MVPPGIAQQKLLQSCKPLCQDGWGSTALPCRVLQYSSRLLRVRRSRGKSLVKLTVSVTRLLEVSGILSNPPSGDSASAPGPQTRPSCAPRPPAGSELFKRMGWPLPAGVPDFMDPCAWPQGEVLIQVGGTQGGCSAGGSITGLYAMKQSGQQHIVCLLHP